MLAGVLISALGIQAMFLCGGLALIVIIVVVRPPLRALWPEPARRVGRRSRCARAPGRA